MKERCDDVLMPVVYSSSIALCIWCKMRSRKRDNDTDWQMSHLTINIRKNDDKYVLIFSMQ